MVRSQLTKPFLQTLNPGMDGSAFRNICILYHARLPFEANKGETWQSLQLTSLILKVQ